MRLSISARIFLGFLVVVIAFGGVMGYTFSRMHRLRQDLHLINKSYLQLTLILAELHTIQGNLLNTIAERGSGGGTSKFLRTQVRLARIYRVGEVKRALKVVNRAKQSLPSSAERRPAGRGERSTTQQFMSEIGQRLLRLRQTFQQNEPLFDQLFPGGSSLHEEPGRTMDQPTQQRVGGDLLRLERRLAAQIRSLRDDVRGQVRATANQVEVDQSNAIWAILVAMLITVLVSLMVTIGSQLTLRPLKTLVAGTKRIGTGDYAHRVQVQSHDELGLLGQEFNSMAAAIEEREQRLIRSERMAAAGQIASHITHEIRNPLSSISLNTELLEEEFEQKDDPGGGEPRKLCQAIRREVDRLTDITEEYLRFARLPRPNLEPEEINEILLDLLSFVASEMQTRRVELKHSLAPDLPLVEADENQLRQAFINLLRNAGEAMAHDGGTLNVSTRATEANDAVEIVIADTGIGISEEHLSKLFEPFFSTKETGTGLGLALTHQIIQEHGGNISVQSMRGAGTRFLVRLPATARGRSTPPADN